MKNIMNKRGDNMATDAYLVTSYGICNMVTLVNQIAGYEYMETSDIKMYVNFLKSNLHSLSSYNHLPDGSIVSNPAEEIIIMLTYIIDSFAKENYLDKSDIIRYVDMFNSCLNALRERLW